MFSRASACAHVKLLEGFWDCGRVCGDRSVFVTSHRPAHTSRAHVFSFDRILHFAFEVISCLHGSACPVLLRCSACLFWLRCSAYLFWLRSTGYCLRFGRVFLCSQLASSESPGIIGQHQQPHWLALRRSRNEPFSITSYGEPLSQELPGQNPFGICHNSQNMREERS